MTLFWYYRPEQLKCNNSNFKKKIPATSTASSTSTTTATSSTSPSAKTASFTSSNSSPTSVSSPFIGSKMHVDNADAEAGCRRRILSSTRVLKSSLRLNHRPVEMSSVDDITKSKVAEFMNSNEVFATKHLDYNSVACIEGDDEDD